MPDSLKFHHVAVATADIQGSAEAYALMGYKDVSGVIEDPIQGVEVCFLEKEKFPRIELVRPLNENSPVSNIIKRAGGATPYHFCYLTKNIETEIKTMRGMGYLLISKPVPAIAFDQHKICFLFKKSIGLIELVEDAE